MTDWRWHNVHCAECGAALSRRINRYDAAGSVVPILRAFCDRRCKGRWQVRETERPVDAAWLRLKYVSEGLDCVQIGHLVNRDPKTVWAWMRAWGIPTRPRGSNEAFLFKRGERSRFSGHRHSEANRARFREFRLKDGRVPYLKDGKPYWLGKKGQEHVSWRGGVTPERQAFYSSPEWRTAAVAVYVREGNRCQRCRLERRELKLRGHRLHVHHVVSFAVRELRTVDSNLALLCGPCHRWVHSLLNVRREFLGAAA